ncbi:MAG: hypothetical protein ACI4SG_05285 [Oligosphaeraceae bacterium]
MFKKDPNAAKPENAAAPAPAPAPEPKKAAPAGPKAKKTLGDFAIMGTVILLAATVVLQLLALKALFLF